MCIKGALRWLKQAYICASKNHLLCSTNGNTPLIFLNDYRPRSIREPASPGLQFLYKMISLFCCLQNIVG